LDFFCRHILAVFYPAYRRAWDGRFKGLHLSPGFIEGDTFGNLASIGSYCWQHSSSAAARCELIPHTQTGSRNFTTVGCSYLRLQQTSSMGGG
jgi:hypothetical protein